MPPETKWSHENGTHEHQPQHPPGAAHAAPDPPAAPGTAPAADSPATAVHAALAANPGSAVAAIADAAGTGKPAARAALLAMEKTGTATRVKGTKPGIPDVERRPGFPWFGLFAALTVPMRDLGEAA
jgi:hypothetical protein